jgi:hypothetical protein
MASNRSFSDGLPCVQWFEVEVDDWIAHRGLFTALGTDSALTMAQKMPGTAGSMALSVVVPKREPIRMHRLAKLPPGPVKENTGIVRSRRIPVLFWMHNDSGDEPRVSPIHRNGEAYHSTREPQTPGVLIGGAINVDWEDITIDEEGNLIVADVGNNENDRRDLVLYYLPEPSVVITYKAIWLFERDDASQPLFGGRIYYAPYQSAQVEAVCFADENTLLIADEETGELFEVQISGLTKVR